MQLFGGKLPLDDGEVPRQHFDYFMPAMLTTFIAMTGEWNETFQACAEGGGFWAAMGYFTALLLVGFLVLANLFVAILAEAFSLDDDEEGGGGEAEEARGGDEGADGAPAAAGGMVTTAGGQSPTYPVPEPTGKKKYTVDHRRWAGLRARLVPRGGDAAVVRGRHPPPHLRLLRHARAGHAAARPGVRLGVVAQDDGRVDDVVLRARVCDEGARVRAMA